LLQRIRTHVRIEGGRVNPALQQRAHSIRRIEGIDHLDLVVTDFERSLAFSIESGPQEYGYTPGYYAVFFYDPDAIKLEIVHRPPRPT
jgi:glyoxylase I family protein